MIYKNNNLNQVMKESEVEDIVREYIKINYLPKNWKYPKDGKLTKKKAEHGADIIIYNQKKGDYILIEVKKWSKTHAVNHNAFYSLFGQLLSRIKDVPSKIYQKRKKMVIAVPTPFVDLIHKKVINIKNGKQKGMEGGWSLFSKAVNLRIWGVDMRSKSVKEYHWKEFLKENLS